MLHIYWLLNKGKAKRLFSKIITPSKIFWSPFDVHILSISVSHPHKVTLGLLNSFLMGSLASSPFNTSQLKFYFISVLTRLKWCPLFKGSCLKSFVCHWKPLRLYYNITGSAYIYIIRRKWSQSVRSESWNWILP